MKPHKTPLEKDLSIYYQSEMKRYDIVPQHVIDAYRRHVEIIRLENPLYNKFLN